MSLIADQFYDALVSLVEISGILLIMKPAPAGSWLFIPERIIYVIRPRDLIYVL